MILAFLNLPLPLRLALVAVAAAVMAAVVNWAVYAFAYHSEFDGPWSRKPRHDLTFGRSDRVPLYGWWRLRRFTPQLGRRYWLQPLVVEIVCAVGAPWWYWWETVRGGLWNPQLPAEIIAVEPTLGMVLHMQFLVHLTLAMFMLAASLIDADEQNIPDAVTVPGTLVGLTLLTCFPLGLMPHYFDAVTLKFFWLHVSEPGGLPEWFVPGDFIGLFAGLACFGFWIFGLIFGGRIDGLRWTSPKFRRSLRVFFGRVRFDPNLPWIIGCGVVGSVLIAMVRHYDPSRWATLLTALVGMASGAAIVWIVRVLGSWAFQKEAMGFGDVTLMAMMGAYLGWQPTNIIFFAAPIAALVICLPSYLFGTREMLPYGPYLCTAALAVMIGWAEVWHWTAAWFLFPWLIPSVLIFGFLLLGIVLSLVRKARSLMGHESA